MPVGAELADDLLRRLSVTLTVPPLRHRIDEAHHLKMRRRTTGVTGFPVAMVKTTTTPAYDAASQRACSPAEHGTPDDDAARPRARCTPGDRSRATARKREPARTRNPGSGTGS